MDKKRGAFRFLHPHHLPMKFSVAALAALALACLFACREPKEGENAPPSPGKVSFVSDIKPFFESSCLSCHNSDTLFGHLNLESRQLAFKPGPHGPFIVPGNPGGSLLYTALLLSELKDEAMPPKGHRIDQREIRLIHDWILEGAEWPEGEDGRLVPQGIQNPPAV